MGLVRDLASLAAALVVLLASASCGSRMLMLPSKGGPSWREHKSDHFTIKADMPPSDAQRLASELEEVHALLNTVAANGKASDVKCTVVVFRSKDEYLPFAPSKSTDGFYFAG